MVVHTPDHTDLFHWQRSSGFPLLVESQESKTSEPDQGCHSRYRCDGVPHDNSPPFLCPPLRPVHWSLKSVHPYFIGNWACQHFKPKRSFLPSRPNPLWLTCKFSLAVWHYICMEWCCLEIALHCGFDIYAHQCLSKASLCLHDDTHGENRQSLPLPRTYTCV